MKSEYQLSRNENQRLQENKSLNSSLIPPTWNPTGQDLILYRKKTQECLQLEADEKQREKDRATETEKDRKTSICFHLILFIHPDFPPKLIIRLRINIDIRKKQNKTKQTDWSVGEARSENPWVGYSGWTSVGRRLHFWNYHESGTNWLMWGLRVIQYIISELFRLKCYKWI